MHALTKITEHELADERRRVFEEARKDAVLVLEAMNECHDWHAYYVARDVLPFQSEVDRILWKYLESCGEFETAESEAQGRKERG